MIDYYGELKEARKEDDLCFSGAFWIIADSYSNILKSKFDLKAGKYLVDYKGNEIHKTSKSSKTHKAIWDNTNGVDYKNYPRGTANRDLSHANRRAAGLDAAKWELTENKEMGYAQLDQKCSCCPEESDQEVSGLYDR